MPLIEQVEEFQAIMDKISSLVEEAKALSGELPDTPLYESPGKMQTIFELCSEGNNNLMRAVAQAEEIQSTLGL